MNHSFLDITALFPPPDWLIGVDSLDLCKDEKRVTFTSPNWPTETRSVVIVVNNTDNLCPLKEQPHHYQQPLSHPNGHDEHEDSLQFNIVSHDYHDQRLDTNGAGVLGDSLRVSGLDLPDDDDGSRVDDFNCDDKGVHHNKEDNPFPQSHTQYTQSQNSLWTANGTDIPSSNWLRDEKRLNLTRWPRPRHGHHYPSRPSVIPSSNGLIGLDGFYLTTVSKIPPG